MKTEKVFNMIYKNEYVICFGTPSMPQNVNEIHLSPNSRDCLTLLPVAYTPIRLCQSIGYANMLDSNAWFYFRADFNLILTAVTS